MGTLGLCPPEFEMRDVAGSVGVRRPHNLIVGGHESLDEPVLVGLSCARISRS
jgi:hypothetical protein